MNRRIVISLALALAATGCATVHDTIEGRRSGTSRVVNAPYDTTWTAMLGVTQRYPGHGDKAEGTQVTDWEERLVDPQVFAEHGILKERTRFEISIAARDDGSRVAVRRSIELLAPVFLDPVAPGPKAFCQYPPSQLPSPERLWPTPQSIVYPTYVCVLENPWEKPRGAPVYAWQDISQVSNPPGAFSGASEQDILDAIEAAAQRTVERPSGPDTLPANAAN